MTDDELAEIRGSLSAFAELVLGVKDGTLKTRFEILEAVEKARKGLLDYQLDYQDLWKRRETAGKDEDDDNDSGI